jgi:hypothetical protein
MKRKRVIGVHVRRGDYRDYSDVFGLLSGEYYAKAIKGIMNSIKDAEVWLFSDQPTEVFMEFKEIGLKIDFIVPTSELNAAETLKLMSQCHGLVTANSTFSWWAANLGHIPLVVSPSPWFRSEGNWLREKDLIPPNWMRQPARWIDPSPSMKDA